jgi:hypothetical protein
MRLLLQFLLLSLLLALTTVSRAAEYQELTERGFERLDGQYGIILLAVNWGRRWGCAGLDNAQLQTLTFARLSDQSTLVDDTTIKLKTPSRLFVDNVYKPYALSVKPGVYGLAGFDVKIARSVSDVGHMIGNTSNLFDDSKPVGGTFSVSKGEIVYIGHFSLDCAEEPIPWRFYIEGQEEFDKYVAEFKERFPYVGDTPVRFRLFATTMFGLDYSLDDEDR